MTLNLKDLGLTEKDWLLDGGPVRGDLMLKRFAALDWSRAWIDLGSSPAGNFGPYWHVPLIEDDDEVVHRLYPKVLTGKWGPLMRQACLDAAEATLLAVAQERARERAVDGDGGQE